MSTYAKDRLAAAAEMVNPPIRSIAEILFSNLDRSRFSITWRLITDSGVRHPQPSIRVNNCVTPASAALSRELVGS
jgi:hypothetical protein